MWWRQRLPQPCEQCQALLGRIALRRAGARKDWRRGEGTNGNLALAPHEGMERRGTLNYFDDGGIELHRCRACGSWWEFVHAGWWESGNEPDGAYDPVRQVRRTAVASAEQWRERYRYARSAAERLLIALFLVLPCLLLVLGRLYAILGLSADPDFIGPNPWLGLLLSLVPLGAVVMFYRRVGRSP